VADNISNKDIQAKPVLVRGVDAATWRKVRAYVMVQKDTTLGKFVTQALQSALRTVEKKGARP